MAYTDALKSVRAQDYGDSGDEDKESSGGVRVIQLTDDEKKELSGYQQGPGMEQECTVTGTLEEDGHFHVHSVHSPGGGFGPEDAAKVAGQETPMMNLRTQPSPS